MDARDVCLRLLAAESEAEVQKIIESVPEMRDRDNWQPLDRRDTNFNVTSNQASDGAKALTELMTNMVDAVLMKHAFQKGIDPKGTDAPKTMYDAVDVLVKNLYGGKLTSLGSEDLWLREFALKNLVIGITGAKRKREGLPCYTFVDNGEGQRGKDFEDTFLSLSAGNKKSIPFVQGKFNMGSSGVLRYCGRRWFKLIVSRRYDGKSGWCWTLMRRRPGDSDSMPVAEYFILGKTEILSFDSDYLYPFRATTGERYDVKIGTGTVVKLFDYQIGPKFLSFNGTREALNENLVETILPFRILDFRQFPKTEKARKAAQKRGRDRASGVDSRPFYGLEFLLLRSHKEEGLAEEEEDAAAVDEHKIHVGSIEDPDIGTVSVSAIPLKQTIPGWLKESRNRIFHVVNGQVQYKQRRGHLARQCGFPALMDRVVILVDASNLTFSAHNDVWKGDREHVVKTTFGERYLDKVTTTIKESTALKDLNNKIIQQELKRSSKAESNEIFQKLVNLDRNIAGLLSQRDPTIHVPTSGGGETGSETGGGEWNGGKHSPTFIHLEERPKKYGLKVPINHTRPVGARTDAENSYLNRTDNQGRVIIDDEVRVKFGIREYLHDGRLTIYFEPQEEALAVGDTFTFKIGLKDDAMAEAVESEKLVLRVAEEHSPPPPDPNKNKKNKHKSGKGKTNKGKGENAPMLGLPKCTLLTEDGREIDGYGVESWPTGFNGYDGGVIEDLGEEGVVYKINYDNAYHRKYLRSQRSDVARKIVTEKYILGMRILMLGYEHAFRSLQDENGGNGEGVAEFADDFRRMSARGAASTVLALTETLSKIVDRSSVGDDVE